jgi:hypothetical protein
MSEQQLMTGLCTPRTLDTQLKTIVSCLYVHIVKLHTNVYRNKRNISCSHHGMGQLQVHLQYTTCMLLPIATAAVAAA